MNALSEEGDVWDRLDALEARIRALETMPVVVPMAAPKPVKFTATPQIPVTRPGLATDAFIKVWDEWVAFRWTIKKPKPNPVLFSKQLEWLAEPSRVADAIEILEQSLRNGWQGLFDLPASRVLQKPTQQPVKQDSTHTLQEQLKLVEKELDDIRKSAFEDAFGPQYTKAQFERRKVLIAKKKELKERLGLG